MVKFADPYAQLRGAFRVLVVDSDERTLERHQEMLENMPTVMAYTARTAEEAAQLLDDGRQWHACVMDLGIDDVDGDEYYLLREFSEHVPFVVCSAQASLEKGGECVRLGARHILKKHGLAALEARLQEYVAYCIIVAVINAEYQPFGRDSLSRATRALLDACPPSVTAWAGIVGVSTRELRYLWRRSAGAAAKDVLDLYHIVAAALAYHLNHGKPSLWRTPQMRDTSSQDHLCERLSMNRNVFEEMLQCANAA